MRIGIIVNAPGVYRYPKKRYSRRFNTSTIFGMPQEYAESSVSVYKFLAGSFREILTFQEIMEREHTCDIILYHQSRFVSTDIKLSPLQFHEGQFDDLDIHMWLNELDAVILVIPSDMIPTFLDRFPDEVTVPTFVVAGNDAYTALKNVFTHSIHLARRGVAKIDQQNREKLLKHLEMMSNG